MKRNLTLAVAILLIISNLSIAFAGLVDYENNWAKNEINYMKEKGIVEGYQDGTFKPNDNMSKAEFYKVINGLMGYSEKSDNIFLDVTSDLWYYEEVQKGIKAKYILAGTILSANTNISRGEVSRIISKVFEIEENENAAEEFVDFQDFPKELKGIIGGLYKSGFINGFPDGTFKHDADITRAEVVKMLCNISGEIINEASTFSKDVQTNLVVNTADVVLKDMVIEGNLYLTEGIGEGDVTLDNVEVKGEVNIKGGGANSVVIKNSKLTKVVVDKEQGLVRVVFENTTVNEVKTEKEVRIELTNGTEIKIMELDGKIDVAVEKGSAIVTIDAVSKEIIIESKGTIGSLTSSEEVKVNGSTVKPNTEVKVDAGKTTEVKPTTPTKPDSKPSRDDNYYDDYVSITPKPTTKVESVLASNGTIKISGTESKVGDILNIKLSDIPNIEPTAMSVLIRRTINSLNDESFKWIGGWSDWNQENRILRVFGIEPVEKTNRDQTIVYSVSYGNTTPIKANPLLVKAETGDQKIKVEFNNSVIYLEENQEFSDIPDRLMLEPSDATLTFESSNPAIVEIKKDTGLMKGISVGDAIIYVTASKDGYVTTTTQFKVSVEIEEINNVEVVSVDAKDGLVKVKIDQSKHISRNRWSITQDIGEEKDIPVEIGDIIGQDDLFELYIEKLDTKYYGKSVVIYVSIDGKDAVASNSFVVEKPLEEQGAPIGVEVVAVTAAGNDGKITGVTDAMEYRLLGAVDFIPATGEEVIGLSAGRYEVRLKAKEGFNAGVIVEVEVKVKQELVAVETITVTGAKDGDKDASTITISKGTIQMSAQVKPSNSEQKVIWSVEAGTGTATISDSGYLTALTNGTVIVKATAKDGSGITGSKEITISGQ